jgi:hypothetical protein
VEVDGSLDHDQWPRACAGYRERAPGLLELRVVLDRGEGVCDVFVHEEAMRVAVEVLVCGDPVDLTLEVQPACVYLRRPLAGRPVFDLVGERWVPRAEAVRAR